MKKKEFTVNDEEFVVHSITPDVQFEASKYYAQAFSEALEMGIPLKMEAEKLLAERNLINLEDDEKRRAELQQEIRDNEVKLRRGKKENNQQMTKEEGKQLALHIRSLRKKLDEIGESVNSFLTNTVESFANNIQLQYYIYASTYRKDTGERYWRNFEQFKNDIDNPVYIEATQEFLTLISGLDDIFDVKNYEDTWLIKMGYMNEKLQFIDEKGRLVDEEGRLIDEEGRFIDEEGNFIDAYGYKIDEKGELIETDGWEYN